MPFTGSLFLMLIGEICVICGLTLSKQFRFIDRLILSHSHPIHRVLEHAGLDMAQRRDFARGAIGGFLNHVAGMTLLPGPFDLMTGRRIVQALPPFVICLATKAARHRLDHIARVGVQTHHTGFGQGFEAECGGGNLGLLVGGLAQISSERAPQSAKPEQRYRRRARFFAAIAEARAVTIDGDRLRRFAIGFGFRSQVV